MGIPKTRIYRDLTQVTLESFSEKIIYDDIDSLINDEKERAMIFLTDCLNRKSTYKHEEITTESFLEKRIVPLWARLRDYISTRGH